MVLKHCCRPSKSQIRPSGTHKFSPFEIVTGCPMYLAPTSFRLTTHDKRRNTSILQRPNCFFKNNHALVEQSFHSTLSGDRPKASHLATWRFCLLEKISPKVFSSTSFEWPLSGTANLSLGHQTPRSRQMDSQDMPKESTESWLDCMPSGDLKVKYFLELKQVTSVKIIFPGDQNQACWKFIPTSLMMTYCFRWSPTSMILKIYGL